MSNTPGVCSGIIWMLNSFAAEGIGICLPHAVYSNGIVINGDAFVCLLSQRWAHKGF